MGGSVATWVWDASALHHAAQAERLDVLLDYTKAIAEAPARHVTTATVVDELTRNGSWSACQPYLDVVELDSLDEIRAVIRWLEIVSGGRRNRGEATVFAWAETKRVLAIIDDGDARRAGQRHGLEVHGTLWIVVQAMKALAVTPTGAESLVAALRSTGARLPAFPPGGIEAWAQRHDLL
jgi:predicted nucleic acid-binding protein